MVTENKKLSEQFEKAIERDLMMWVNYSVDHKIRLRTWKAFIDSLPLTPERFGIYVGVSTLEVSYWCFDAQESDAIKEQVEKATGCLMERFLDAGTGEYKWQLWKKDGEGRGEVRVVIAHARAPDGCVLVKKERVVTVFEESCVEGVKANES